MFSRRLAGMGILITFGGGASYSFRGEKKHTEKNGGGNAEDKAAFLAFLPVSRSKTDKKKQPGAALEHLK